MKEIIDAYGEFFLEVIVIGLLFVNVFCGIEDKCGDKGILRVVGKNIPIEKVNHMEFWDFNKTYRDESKKSMPQIYFVGTHLKTGSNKLSDFLVAYDYAGRELPITLQQVTDMVGTEIVDIYDEGASEIYFSSAGIYIVEAETRDNENRVYRCKIQLPVCL